MRITTEALVICAMGFGAGLVFSCTLMLLAEVTR